MQLGNQIIHGDCLEWMRAQPADSVDLVFTSPPYEAARTYGVDFKLRGEDWVTWAFDRYAESLRICRGLVAWVVEGQTRKFRYSGTPILLAADLIRAGYAARKPPVFYRNGIPGSGGPDYWRNDWEFCLCFMRTAGRLPWSDNTAMGKPPKYGPGGAMSHRLPSGLRAGDKWTGHGASANADGTHKRKSSYRIPKIANPGNVIKCDVGGGRMGSLLAHDNEAPFPELLANRFIRSFCPPGGIVLDTFCGSGTTLAVAEKTGRAWIGVDVRESQVELSRRRIEEVRQLALAA